MTFARLAFALTLLAITAASVPAAVVVFQAEDFAATTDGSSGPGFSVVADAGAYFGQGITTLGDTTASPPPSHTATYNLTFTDAGTYYLYLRFVTDTEGNNPGSAGNLSDSLFIANSFGSSPAGYLNINGLAYMSSPNVYAWANLSTWSGHASSSTGITYNVAAPAALSFVIGGREAGLTLDAFVFSTDANLSSAQLNALAIPEPATAVLLGVASLTLLRRRRGCLPDSREALLRGY